MLSVRCSPGSSVLTLRCEVWAWEAGREHWALSIELRAWEAGRLGDWVGIH